MKVSRMLLAGCAGVASLLLFQACKKDLEKKVPENFSFANTSQVQVFNAMLGSNRTYVYVDGAPVTGAALGYGTAFPASALNFSIPAGLRAFVVKDTQVNSAQQQLVFSENLQSNKNYTVFVYDTANTPKQVTIETVLQHPTDTTARLRFANFVYTTAGTQPVDVFSKKRNETVWSGVIKTQVTDFIPYASARNDTLIVRAAGTTTALATLNGFNPTQSRSYTLIYRGGATKAVSAFANY